MNTVNNSSVWLAYLACFFISLGAYCTDTPLILTVKTDNTGDSADDQFTLPLRSASTYDFTVDYDGQQTTHTSGNDLTLTFPSGAGTYDLTINGTFPALDFYHSGDRLKLVEVKQWGTCCKWETMESAFYDCKNLKVTATDVPDLSAVTTMMNMFHNCQAMDAVTVSNWDVSNVASMRQMFYNCLALTGISGTETWDVGKVTTMYRMFNKCKVLQTLNLTGWDTSSVLDMGFMFSACNALTGITGLKDLDVASLKTCRLMFENVNMATVDLSNWNTVSLENIDYMFQSSSITSIVGLENWDVKKLAGARGVFYGNPLTTAQYDALLMAYAAQLSNRPDDLYTIFEPRNSQYSRDPAVIAARDQLIAANWTIKDGGTANTVPVADAQTVAAAGTGSTNITLTGSDADSDPLSFEIRTLPKHGTLTGSGANLVYTPNDAVGVVDSFTFYVNDGFADSAEATVTVNVDVVGWDGGGSDNLFSTAANWTGDVLPQAGQLLVFDATGSKPCVIDIDVSVGGMRIDAGYAGSVSCGANTLTISGPICELGSQTQFNADSGVLRFAGAMPQTLVAESGETFATLDLSGAEVTINESLTCTALTATAGALLRAAPGSEITTTSLSLQGTANAPIIAKSSAPGNAWKLTLGGGSQSVSYVLAADSDASAGATISDTTGGIDLGGCSNWQFGTGVAVTSNTSSAVSPAWVEGANSPGAASVSISVDGGPSFAAVRMNDTQFYADNASASGRASGIDLDPDTPVSVTVTTPAAQTVAAFTWTPTGFDGATVTIRRGSSLLLTADGAGQTLTIDADGDATSDFTGAPGDKAPYLYSTAGTYTAAAEIDGQPVGTLTVQVVDFVGIPRVGTSYGGTRTRDLLVTHNVPVTFWAPPDNELALTCTPLNNGVQIKTGPPTTGERSGWLRLGADDGPVLTSIAVATISFVSTRTSNLPVIKEYGDQSYLLASPFKITPALPGYELKFYIYTGGALFEESGSHIMWVPTSSVNRHGEGLLYLLVYPDYGSCHAYYGVRETEEN